MLSLLFSEAESILEATSAPSPACRATFRFSLNLSSRTKVREEFNAASNERDPEPSRGYARESSTFLDFPVSVSSKAVDVE